MKPYPRPYPSITSTFAELFPKGDQACVEAVVSAYKAAPRHLAFDTAVKEWRRRNGSASEHAGPLVVAAIISTYDPNAKLNTYRRLYRR